MTKREWFIIFLLGFLSSVVALAFVSFLGYQYGKQQLAANQQSVTNSVLTAALSAFTK